MIAQFIINGLVKGSMYGIIGLAFSLVYNTSRIFHIAMAGLIVVAAYLTMVFYAILNVPFGISIGISATLTGGISVLIDRGVYSRFEKKRASHNIILIASLAIFMIVINSIAIIFGNETKVLSSELSKAYHFGDLLLTQNQLYLFFVSVFASVLVLLGLSRSTLGIKIRGLKDNPLLMEVLGHNPVEIKTAVYFISGVLVTIPASLLAYDVGMDPYFGMPIFLNAIVAMIIGGIDDLRAPILGGLVLGVVQGLSVYFFEAKWESMISFMVLIVFLLLKPKGLLVTETREV